MLVTVKKYRRNGIAKKLVNLYIDELKNLNADEAVLETECVNKAALKLYESSICLIFLIFL